MVKITIAAWLFLGWIASGVRAQEAPTPDKERLQSFQSRAGKFDA
jgi:hypothetical protein